MVLTSADEIGGKPTGYTLSEAAHPWKVFRDAGHAVDFASIKGGTPPIDPNSERDEMLITRPHFFSIICGSTAREHRKAPFRMMSTTLSQDCSVILVR